MNECMDGWIEGWMCVWGGGLEMEMASVAHVLRDYGIRSGNNQFKTNSRNAGWKASTGPACQVPRGPRRCLKDNYLIYKKFNNMDILLLDFWGQGPASLVQLSRAMMIEDVLNAVFVAAEKLPGKRLKELIPGWTLASSFSDPLLTTIDSLSPQA